MSEASSAKRAHSPPLPLVIAVSGHRDLIEEDEKRLRGQVEAVFDELDHRYPFCRPFRVLSGLAEGADRLVAHVALRRGAQLVACLPMQHELYETDFETAESRAEFDRLLRRAAICDARPLVEDNTPQNVSEKTRRDRQYDALGKFLVNECHILIALWDGADKHLPGGTSAVVRQQRYGKFGEIGLDPHHPLHFPETGPVYHVLTPRQGNPAPVGNLDQWQFLYDPSFKTEDEARKHYQRVFGRMNAFNRDAGRHGVVRAKMKEKSAQCLLPESSRANLPPELQTLIDHYALSDCLAVYYRWRTRLALRFLIFIAGLSGILLFELFAHGPEKYHGAFLLAYVFIIAASYAIYKSANFREIKTRHLDYRALAEGLRLQIFWKLSGLTDSISNHYLAKQRTELDWIRQASEWWSKPLASFHLEPDWTLVGKHWLQDQFGFFAQSAERNHRGHEIELNCYRGLLFAVAALGLIVLVTQFAAMPALPDFFYKEWIAGFKRHGILVIAMTMLPALAGAISAYALKMAFSEQTKQYGRMRDLYERGLICFERAMLSHAGDRDKSLGTIVHELGKEALSENADWVLMHRERSLEMFVGG